MNTPQPPPAPARTFGLPRGVLIMLGLASMVIVLFGMRQVAGILAPIFLALSLTITVYPLRPLLQRHGVPRWLATLLVILGVYLLLVGLMLAFILGVARLADLLPAYVPQMQQRIADLQSWLTGLGVGHDQLQNALKGLNPGTIISLVGGIVGSLMNVLSLLVFVVTLVLFMGIDSAVFTTRMEKVRGGREQALSALTSFAFGTRKYFIVSTIFGGIVAVLDWLALVILDVPAALLWGVLAFVTNYIPNIGFLIGVIPPALLALLTGGVGRMVAVIIVYCVLNFIIQSVIQPKYVGDSVGLTTTVSFLSLIVWAYVLGPLGAILAVPMTLLAKALLVDVDPETKWLQLFLGDEPHHESRKQRRAGAAAASAGRSDDGAAPEDDHAG
ncbi:AI-2E family transporter [Nakamurella lactea]|uniref:AI-2E family transporter n=1 Tax=Nakamurella lactea TaxID=459515 RepID=UPI0004281F9F|nr:AI-2E family transporter [Nakamurella lactea]